MAAIDSANPAEPKSGVPASSPPLKNRAKDKIPEPSRSDENPVYSDQKQPGGAFQIESDRLSFAGREPKTNGPSSRPERVQAMKERAKDDKGPSWTQLGKSAVAAKSGGSKGSAKTSTNQSVTATKSNKLQDAAGGIDAQATLQHIKNRERPVDADQIIAILQELAPEFVIPIRIGLKVLRINERRVIDAVWPEEDLEPLKKPWRIWILIADISWRLALLGILAFLAQLALWAFLILLIIIAFCKFFPGSSIILPQCTQISSFVGNAISGGTFAGGTTTTGSPPQPGGTCSPLQSGPASEENLRTTCFGENAAEASGIARQESGGDPFRESRSDRCTGGESASIGLFQINISAHKIGGLNCPAAFNHPYTASQSCTVVNQALYQQCVAAAKDPAQNIAEACRISGNGSNWNAWGANKICKF